MSNRDYTIKQEQIARFAKAMGHPARIAILQFLAKHTTCYFGDIHEELPIAKATVSQHLKELKEAGLIQGEVETPKVKYCINRENWKVAKQLFGEFLMIVNLNQKHILYTKLFSNQHLISANSATFFIKSSNVQEGALPPFDFISNRAVSLFHFNLTL